MRHLVRRTLIVLAAFVIALPGQSGAGASSASAIFLQEPENHASTVARLTRYHDSGEYEREIREVANAARDYLSAIVQTRKPGERFAAIFDIDETALSNWNATIKCGFCSYPTQRELYLKAHDEDYSGENDPAIIPTLELYNFARKNEIAVFFVTGRTEDQRAVTERNLAAAGYSNWKELKMCDNMVDNECGKNPPPRASLIKPRIRQRISDEGYRVVLNIGDQASDLAGCCAERTFKLPNPFYEVD